MTPGEHNFSFDINEVVASLIQRHFEATGENARRWVSWINKETRRALGILFKEYLTDAYERHSKTKTLLYHEEAVPLYNFYVPLDLKCADRLLRSASIKDIHDDGRPLLITGIAGTGKSTLLKHFFLDSLRHGITVPIFIPLREFNNAKKDLLEIVSDTVELRQKKINSGDVLDTLARGSFVLFLDGYDEVNTELRPYVRASIFKLVKYYPGTQVVVSSRPDEEFVGWTEFAEYEALKLDKSKALQLISKLHYDPQVKSRFLGELSDGLYERHESFLSNPLLLTIMLMTYRATADIPAKKHVFFAQVFETLFNRHDATKQGYKRQLRSRLAMDDFARVLSVISLQSYLEGEVTFSEMTALEYLAHAASITGLTFSTEDFLDDLLGSVCLLVRDGLLLSYTHKQIQEYFVAVFINSSSEKYQKKLLGVVSPSFDVTEVIRILFEMNPPLVEKVWIEPAIAKILRQSGFKESDELSVRARFYSLFLRDCEQEDDEILWQVKDSTLLRFFAFLSDSYRIAELTAESDTRRVLVFEDVREKEDRESDRGDGPSKLWRDLGTVSKLEESGALPKRYFEIILEIRNQLTSQHNTTALSIDEMLDAAHSRRSIRRVRRSSIETAAPEKRPRSRR